MCLHLMHASSRLVQGKRRTSSRNSFVRPPWSTPASSYPCSLMKETRSGRRMSAPTPASAVLASSSSADRRTLTSSGCRAVADLREDQRTTRRPASDHSHLMAHLTRHEKIHHRQACDCFDVPKSFAGLEVDPTTCSTGTGKGKHVPVMNCFSTTITSASRRHRFCRAGMTEAGQEEQRLAHVAFSPTISDRNTSTRCAYGTHCGASSSSAASAAGPYRLFATDARFLSSSGVHDLASAGGVFLPRASAGAEPLARYCLDSQPSLAFRKQNVIACRFFYI